MAKPLALLMPLDVWPRKNHAQHYDLKPAFQNLLWPVAAADYFTVNPLLAWFSLHVIGIRRCQ